ncbi:MAG: sugar ABC transporter substrate-binding protein [Acidimicrobiia bacterium]|jgi:simple sugar transport system substrate-binding protein
MKLKRARWVLAGVAIAMLVAACGDSGSSGDTSTAAPSTTATTAAPDATAAGGTYKLGLITKFPVDFYFTIEDAAKAWADQHPDVELITGMGESASDDEGVIALIESMVAQGVDGIAVTPTGEAVIPALDAAVAAGVKIILVDNDLPDWNGKTAVVATNNHDGGVLAGQWLAEQLPAGSTLGVLEGRAGVPALDARVDGMIEGLGDADITIVSQTPTDCDQVKGVSAAEDLLTAHPDVTAIYGACGPPILGALEAIDNAGIAPDDIVVVGFDALPDEVAAIAAGTEDASVAQFPPKMGELGMDTLYRAVQGETVEPDVDTGTAVVTADNVGDFS